MTHKTNFFDQEIGRAVRSVEQEVPQGVEQAFMAALEQIEPLRMVTPPATSNGKRFLRTGFWAAATVLLAVVMLIVYMIFQHSDPSPSQVAEAEEVSVQDSWVEDQPASTYVVTPRDSNMTIVWVEKIKNNT